MFYNKIKIIMIATSKLNENIRIFTMPENSNIAPVYKNEIEHKERSYEVNENSFYFVL